MNALPRKHALPVFTLLSALTFIGPAHAAGPSFDCTKAATPIEKLICKEPRLADLDARLERTIRDKLAQDPTAGAALLAAERQWLRSRDNACSAEAAAAQTQPAVACLTAAYQSRIAALSTPPTANLCDKIVASYKTLLASDPDAPFHKGFYGQSPLATLAGNAASGVSLAPHAAVLGLDPQRGLKAWAAMQKPPVILPEAIQSKLASHNIIDGLPGTNIYAASTIDGTADCYDSVAFEVKDASAELAQGPGNWTDENGAGCGVTRNFGKVGATPAAFQESYDYTPALASSLSVSGWSDNRFGPVCTIAFQFAPRFAPQGTFNAWDQSCKGRDCAALRQAALGLVETIQADPRGAETTLDAKLTPAQRRAFYAMKAAAHIKTPQKIAADPAQLTDKSPLLLPLVVGPHLYLARAGHFSIGWRSFSDWSVKIDRRNGHQIAAFAIGMTNGKLVKADVK
ncbi:MAG: lysozyme inhibitor LprI family protein [Methylovirgula sp.]